MARRKKTRSCPSCDRNFTKGKIVQRLGLEGFERIRVCKLCAAKATPMLLGDTRNLCIECGRNLACFCRACVGKQVEQGQRVLAALAAIEGRRVLTKK